MFVNVINRLLGDVIESKVGSKKAILIFGPRQSGKTTLMKKIASRYTNRSLWLNADEPDVRDKLSNQTSSALNRLIGNAKILFIDEAQRIVNIGLTLKLIVDNIPDVQVIATGSSAFELADKIKEPLTGRKFEYHLYPISTEEMVKHDGSLEEERMLESRLLYGMYPEVVTNPGQEKELLLALTDSVLYKDLFALESVKKPELLEKLLKALALQVGQEVSYHELSQIVNADKETVERYIHLLEKTFVIFRLSALSRNVRNELKRSRKIYFYDNGVRNSLIANFNSLALRQDKGALWENFLMSERLKFLHYHGLTVNRYFWRTLQQQEIDYIEESEGKLHAFEFKFSKNKAILSKTFSNAYPNHTFKIVNKENYIDFLTGS